jgi:hypothetical protein
MSLLAEEVLFFHSYRLERRLTFVGQSLLAYIAYSVFTKSLVRNMEQRPVSYGTFEAITFRNSTVVSLWLMLRDYATNGGGRAKAAIMWMIVASSYVLAFPTLMSAVTGYSSNSQGK